MNIQKIGLIAAISLITFLSAIVSAQTTAFTFQGRLNTSGSPASGTYEMQFQLFDSVKGGAQIGATFTDPNVAVVNGVFTTTLDFGAAAFDGSARFVEIGVRTAGNPDPFTTLAPRQTIKSAPYSIQSKNAATADALSANCVNCVTSGQIQSIDGSQVTGAIPPASVPMGSDNYIQNAAVFRGEGKDGGQPAARFNIGGNATVGSLDVNGPASFAAVGAPAVAPAGQGRIYFDSGSNKVKVSENGGAFVNLVGATGVSGSGTVNTIPLFSAGTTLANSLITQNANGVQLPNGVQLALGAQGNQVAFGSPNGETGMSISGPAAVNRADVRFGPSIGNASINSLKLLIGPSGVPPSFGIEVTPTLVKMPNGVLLAAGAQGNQVSFGSPNGETGMTIAGATGRADVRFDGITLKLNAGPAGSPPANGITINTTGGATVTGLNGDGAVLTARHSSLDSYIIVDATSVARNSVLAFRKNNFNRWLMFADNVSETGGNAGSDFRLDAYSNTGGIATHLFVKRSTGNVGIGTTNPVAKLHVIGTTRTSVVEVTGGSDLAEKFSFSEPVKPGMVVAIDPKNAGKLTLARGAYNRRVAGIISGANNLSVGMLLPDLADGNTAQPVALSGRVWVYADAGKAGIKPGDLLTSSQTPGHAMKVTNHRRANGSIIGKAMTELKTGTGLVLVLVSLQ